MAPGDLGSLAEHPKSMRTGVDKKFFKSSNPRISTQEIIIAPSQPDQSTYMQMQAYFCAPSWPIPPSFSIPSFTSSATPHHVLVNQYSSVEPFATPPQYSVLYSHGGLHDHPKDLAFNSEAQGKTSNGIDWDSRRKCKGSSDSKGFVGGSSGESGKTACGSGTDGASQSGNAGSDRIDDKADRGEFPATKKRTFNQMLADACTEANAQNKNTAHCADAKPQVSGSEGSMPASNWNMGISSNASSAASKFMTVRPNNASVVSETVTSGQMVSHKKVMSEQQIQDERTSQKERKKLRNREAAKRSRIRRKQEHEELEDKVKALSSETSMLTRNINRHSMECNKIQEQNDSLLEQLEQICDQDVMSFLKDKDPNRESVEHENNRRNRESSGEHHSSLEQKADTSNSDWMVDAGSN